MAKNNNFKRKVTVKDWEYIEDGRRRHTQQGEISDKPSEDSPQRHGYL